MKMKRYICDTFLKVYMFSRNEWAWVFTTDSVGKLVSNE